MKFLTNWRRLLFLLPGAADNQNVPNENMWAAALAELGGVARRPGVWAKALSEAGGNEEAAKANYLRIRARELQLEEEVERQHRREAAETQRRREEAEGLRLRLEAEMRDALYPHAQVSTGTLNDSQTIVACEAQLSALGFQVQRPQQKKWEISNTMGTTYVYSVEELRRETAFFTKLATAAHTSSRPDETAGRQDR